MLDEVTRTVVEHLAAAGPALEGTQVAAGSPATWTGDADVLLVCLHGVEVGADPQPTRTRHAPPLHLRLRYVTAHAGGDELRVQAALGAVLARVHAAPVVPPERVGGALTGRTAGLTFRPDDLTVTDRHGLWTALGRPLRPALYHLVDVLISPANGPA